MPKNAFVLVYQGPLPTKAKPAAKQAIRLKWHEQLRRLWSAVDGPIDADIARQLEDPSDKLSSAVRHPHGATYVPMIAPKQCIVCELDVLFCLPRTAGTKMDLDNCLKTLFDTLRPPDDPKESAPPVLSPIYCLVSDDEHIHRVTAEYFPLLAPGEPLVVLKVTVIPETSITQMFRLK